LNEKLLFVNNVAERLNCSRSYVYELIKEGVLPAVKNGHIKVKESSIEHFIKSHTTEISEDIPAIKIKRANVVVNETDHLLNAEEIVSRAQPFENCCGVYFLINNGEIVYVGQSVNIWGRLGTHFNDNLKEFDRIAYVLVDKEDLNRVEAAYIRKFQPKYNCK